MTMNDEPVAGEISFFEWAELSGVLEAAALAAVALAVILVVVWRYFVPRPRGRWRLLLPLAFCLGVGGYVVYDYEYIYVNLVMRDAQTVREDCAAARASQDNRHAKRRPILFIFPLRKCRRRSGASGPSGP